MTWVDVFVFFAFIIACIRIVVITKSTADSATKNIAPFDWTISIILFSASWATIRILFPSIKMDMKVGEKVIEEKKIENNNFQKSDTIHIRIKPKKKN